MAETPKSVAKARRGALEDLLWVQMVAGGLPLPARQVGFHPTRRWRFDFAWPERMIAVEVDGGEWITGRHQRPGGWLRDMEKHNAATALGWRVFHFGGTAVKNGEAIACLREVL